MADQQHSDGNHFQKAVPSLPVKNCSEAVRYYCDVLGFKLDFDDAVLGHNETLFARVSRGECEITLNQHDQQDYAATVGCHVEDVDRLHREYGARGVTIFVAPQNEPWGERHMAIEHLDGNKIHFASRIEAMNRANNNE